MKILRRVVGFRSNKLWKMILATLYYWFVILVTIIYVANPYSKDIVQYGNNQDKIASIMQNISVILMFLTPVVVMKMKEIFKLNIPISILVAFVYFIFSCYLLICVPYSEQYNNYLNSKTEIESIESEEIKNNQIDEFDNTKNINDKNKISEDTSKQIEELPIVEDIEEKETITKEVNEKEIIVEEVIKINPLLQLKLKEGNVYNGLKTEIIGTYAYFETDKSILNCSDEEWIEFKQFYKDKTNIYNWVEIDIDDNFAIHFSNDLTIGELRKIENKEMTTSLNNIIIINDDFVELSIMKDNQTYFSNLDKISYYDENGNDVDKIDENCNNVIEIEHNIEPIKEEKVFDDNFVWIDDTGKKYHKKSTCSNMDNPYQVSKNDAISQGRDACKKCYR